MAPGTLLAGRYRIVAQIGRGGMGHVFRAEDLKLNETVALKFLPESLANDPVWLGRFLVEVRTAREVTHPNVCRVHDIVETKDEAGRPLNFLTMEYVDGENLADLIRRFGRLPDDKAMELAGQISAALAASHARGVLHRDIKPANVLIDGRGNAKLADFGLALGSGSLESAEVAGTPGYIAPEMLQGGAATGRSDLYALGLVLYELLTGRRAIKDGKPSLGSIRQYAPEVPADAESMVLACADPDPARRPSSAAEVAAVFPLRNAMEAALARGETPSPEMVADSADETPMPQWQAWSWVAACAVVIVLTWCAARWGGYIQVLPPTLSAQEMELRAKSILEQSGYPSRDLPSRAAITENFDMLDWYTANAGRDLRRRFQDAPLGSLELSYWQSQTGNVMPDNPLLSDVLGQRLRSVTLENSQFAEVDSAGHLLALRSNATLPAANASGVDWNQAIGWTGLDAASIKPADPSFTPPSYATSKRSWIGSYRSNPQMVFRVNAAENAGRINYLQLEAAQNAPESGYSELGVTASNVFQALAFVVSVLLAILNLRNGKGDVRSATRAGVMLFLIGMAYTICVMPLGGSRSADYVYYYITTTGTALVGGCVLWLTYVAIEPLTRRRLPQLLIASSLLLQNKWKSARVGKEILIGLVLGSCSALCFELLHVFSWRYGYRGSLDIFPAQGLLSMRAALGTFAAVSYVGIDRVAEIAVMLTFCLIAVRRLWLAAIIVVCFAVWMGNTHGSLAVGASIGVLLFIPVVVLMVRLGIVASTCFFIGSQFLDTCAWTYSLRSWLAPHMALNIFGLLAATFVAMWLATGRQNPFSALRVEV